MKKIFALISIVSLFLLLKAQENCYTIVVGKNASATGKVIVAHNEDNWVELVVNLHKVPAQNYGKSWQYKLINGDSVTFAKSTYSYLWIEATNVLFGDFFINQYGVSICSNACRSKETDDLKDPANWLKVKQLTHDFRRMIAMRAKNARQAVEIAARLLDTLGYGSSGRTYIFADANEAWIMAVVKGKQYVAVRLADDNVAIIPNYYTIADIDTADKQNVIYSRNLFSYAIQNKWYNPDTQKFNFRLVYSDKENLKSIKNIPRHWAGLNMLHRSYNIFDEFPFSFVPQNKITFEQIKTVLTNHYENTEYASANRTQNPHLALSHPICNDGTVYSVIVEYSDVPENNIIWLSFLNPCINPYIPIPFSVDQIPDFYSNTVLNTWKQTHFSDEYNKHANNPKHVFVLASKYVKIIEDDYLNKIENATKEKKKLEKKFEKQINKKIDSKTSLKILNNYYKVLAKQSQ